MLESILFWVSGEILLNAPCLNLSGRTSVGEAILHVPFCHLSLRSTVGESIARLVPESVSLKSGWEVSLTRPVIESVLSFGLHPFVETVWSFVGWGVSYTPPAQICVFVRGVVSVSFMR